MLKVGSNSSFQEVAMLITKTREFDREIGAQATCPYCTYRIAGPPALLIVKNRAVYHPDCAMQLTYAVQADLSGYPPAAAPPVPNSPREEPEPDGMAQAFRAARHASEIAKYSRSQVCTTLMQGKRPVAYYKAWHEFVTESTKMNEE